MDRRDFLKISGAAAAGLAAASCTGGSSAPAGTGADIPDDAMVARHYPGTGLLGFGCMRWPILEGTEDQIDQEAVNAMVDKALAHGVNYYDTSPVYLMGKSEEAASIALNRHPRSSWILATKLSNFSNSSYENSLAMYRRSMEIFKTDYIDYYLLHSVANANAFRERFESSGIMEFLLKEREAGRIRHLGFSFHGSTEGFDSMMELHDRYHWDFVQIQMNYLDWNHASGRNGNASHLYAELEKRDIPVVIMEPLRGGALADIPAPLAIKLKERTPDASIASWAFRFFEGFPKVLTVLSGMSCMEHLDNNLRTFCDLKGLSQEEKDLLEAIGAEVDKYPLIRCTDCKYCMPCPYGIDIPGIFKFYNSALNEGTYVTSSEQKGFARARRRFLAEYDRAVETIRQADHCISCVKCQAACPQHIRIPRELRRIDEYVESLRQGKL